MHESNIQTCLHPIAFANWWDGSKRIWSRNKSPKHNETQRMHGQIDRMVYEIYGPTEEEVMVVEGE